MKKRQSRRASRSLAARRRPPSAPLGARRTRPAGDDDDRRHDGDDGDDGDSRGGYDTVFWKGEETTPLAERGSVSPPEELRRETAATAVDSVWLVLSSPVEEAVIARLVIAGILALAAVLSAGCGGGGGDHAKVEASLHRYLVSLVPGDAVGFRNCVGVRVFQRARRLARGPRARPGHGLDSGRSVSPGKSRVDASEPNSAVLAR
jgi:hypothetical protein